MRDLVTPRGEKIGMLMHGTRINRGLQASYGQSRQLASYANLELACVLTPHRTKRSQAEMSFMHKQ
jgi:hypothetical protein